MNAEAEGEKLSSQIKTDEYMVRLVIGHPMTVLIRLACVCVYSMYL